MSEGVEIAQPRRGPGRPHGAHPKLAARNLDCKMRYLNGETLQAIANIYNISRERVRQILVKQGIEGFDGGAAVRWELQRLQKHESKIEGCQAKYGCTLEQFQELRSLGKQMIANGEKRERTPIGAWRNRQHNCSMYGITFELTLWEFWTLWQESGHWDERGQGEYGLCRKDTMGGFTKGNVFVRRMKKESRWGEKRSGVASKFKPVP